MAWYNRYKHTKHVKKIHEELLPVECIQEERGIGACPKMKKKEVKSFLIDEK